MKNVVILRTKNGPPRSCFIWSVIEASAVCKKRREIIWNNDFSGKVKETHWLLLLIKTYWEIFDRFIDDVYWECISVLPEDAIDSIDYELERMFYGVIPYRIWSHFWFCTRSQCDQNICQYLYYVKSKEC